MTNFPDWFQTVSRLSPHAWQRQLGSHNLCRDRLLRIPTGFGKTAGVVLPWLFHRVSRDDQAWPARLVFTLPMRVLVEQTTKQVRAWLEAAQLDHVSVDVLMGGEELGEWARTPDAPAILIGTQDMLLSRALNRGYGAGRARWPVDFGLLNHDTLWVLDEIQLMDVGLTTGTQLATFRRQAEQKHGAIRPSYTWWMSATLQPSWLASVETQSVLPELTRSMVTIPEHERRGPLWEVSKRIDRRADITAPTEIAQLIKDVHATRTTTLVVLNRVDKACEVFDELLKLYGVGKRSKPSPAAVPDVRLVHSRFRAAEKLRWSEEFLSRAATGSEGRVDRIIIATQVVEAGVDISAATLITEIAPWASLVQRFGRCARYAGESGSVTVVGGVTDEEGAASYAAAHVAAAARGLDLLISQAADAGPAALERFETELSRTNSDLLAALYPFQPEVVLREQVLRELFDTTPDLSGADLDVSQYIRTGDDRDANLFWRDIEPVRAKGGDRLPWTLVRNVVPRPERQELCPAPVDRVRRWLLKTGTPCWVFDFQSGEWERRAPHRIVAGQQLLIASGSGGYEPSRGFSPNSKRRVESVAARKWDAEEPASLSDSSEDEDALAQTPQWKTIAFHGLEVATEVKSLGERLGLPARLIAVLEVAGRWHDVGKGHEVFQCAIRDDARAAAALPGARRDLAKAPKDAWQRYARPGFRHELASALGLFELLHCWKPEHEALLGPHRDAMDSLRALLPPTGTEAVTRLTDAEISLASELAGLAPDEFDLVAWLVCSHHGKVRCSWTSTPKDQDAGQGHIHGVGDLDTLAGVEVMDSSGCRRNLGGVVLHVEELAAIGLGSRYGASWRERVERQLELRGPLQLAFLEAVFRAADWKASGLATLEDFQ